MESSKEMLDELEQMPMTQFVRKYGHLTFNGIYELLEQQAELLRRAEGMVKEVSEERCCVIHLDRSDGVKHLLKTKAQALLKDLEEARESTEV